MPEEKVLTKEEDKSPSLIEEVRGKSFNQILQEQAKSREDNPTEDKPVETEEEKKKKEDDERLAKEAEDAKAKVEADEADKKRQEEIAAKAAEDVLAKQKAEEDAKLAKEKEDADAKQREEDLKPKFTAKDKDGNAVPKDYVEIAEESARIAREKTLEEIEARDKARKEEEDRIAKDKAQTEEQQKAQREAIETQLQKEMDADLNAIYAAGDMPKVKDVKDENDPGNKEFKNLLETAQRVNAERIAAGEAPIRSLQVIRYGKDTKGKPYYTPLQKADGVDAPVLGSESPLSNEAPDDRYIPARDRQKSMAQLVKEEGQRLARKLNIRGN